MTSQILPHLRQDLIEGRWKPGERLVEPVLCEQFGVSRTPLRDALRILEGEGLVELIPHVGAVVTKPEAADIAGTFDILAVLEASAAEKAAESRNPQLVEKLKQLLKRMHKAVESNQTTRWVTLNDEFHRLLVLETGNERLIEIHEHLMWHVHRVRHITYHNLPFSAERGHQHDALLERIQQGDAAGAFAEMRSHVLSVGKQVLAASNAKKD